MASSSLTPTPSDTEEGNSRPHASPRAAPRRGERGEGYPRGAASGGHVFLLSLLGSARLVHPTGLFLTVTFIRNDDPLTFLFPTSETVNRDGHFFLAPCAPHAPHARHPGMSYHNIQHHTASHE